MDVRGNIKKNVEKVYFVVTAKQIKQAGIILAIIGALFISTTTQSPFFTLTYQQIGLLLIAAGLALNFYDRS